MKYTHIAQKPFCCLAACVEMILEAEKLTHPDQEDIAYELGLILPADKQDLVKKTYVGDRPKAGWGTRIYDPTYSLTHFFQTHAYPLCEIYFSYKDFEDTSKLLEFVKKNLRKKNHILLCFNYPKLHGLQGSWGHAAIVSDVTKSNELVLCDPSVQVAKECVARIENVLPAIKSRSVGQWGIWVISRT